MGDFLIYIIKASLVLTLLFLAYKWLLSHTTFHRQNRITLILILVASWIAPSLPVYTWQSAKVSTSVVIGNPMAIHATVHETFSLSSYFSLWEVLICLYFIGLAISLIFAVIGLIKITKLIKDGTLTKKDDYIEIINDASPGPFSWAGYVVLRSCDLDENYPMVISHELEHKRLLHWIDLLIAEFSASLQWFSPVSWLLIRELKDIHEYEADKSASFGNITRYQLMLINKSTERNMPIFADSLKQTQIRKRILMMSSKRTSPLSRTTVIAIPIAFVAAIAAFSMPEFNALAANFRMASSSLTNISSDMENPLSISSDGTEIPILEKGTTITAESEVPEPSSVKMDMTENEPQIIEHLSGQALASDHYEEPSKKPSEEVFLSAESIAEFKGGRTELLNFINDNINYPDSNDGLAGRIIVSFVISSDGSVSDEKIVKGLSPELDKEAIRLVRLTDGEWIPASINGNPVATRFFMPITFNPMANL